MKLAFIDLTAIDFNPLTPEIAPLGGMQSGVCYLSQSLQRRGHDVTIFNGTTNEGVFAGIPVLNFERSFSGQSIETFDAFISIYCAGKRLRPLVGNKPLILFTGHNSKVQSIMALNDPAERDCWDYFVLKSNWQARNLIGAYALDTRRVRIITNAVSPFFQSLVERRSSFALEGRPPVLYYSSTPFRGLETLVRAMPAVLKAIPGARARVFSSMAPYQASDQEALYAGLYSRCREAGLELVGSLDQRRLAAEVSSADVLAFPSTYPETSCITMMEAMANMSVIVSREIGAIPETAAGFAHLLPETDKTPIDTLPSRYADYLIKVIKAYQQQPERRMARLRQQRQYCITNYNWDRKALEWEEFLRETTQDGGRGRRIDVPQSMPIFSYFNTIRGKKIYVDPQDSRGKRLINQGAVFNHETMSLWKKALGLSKWNVIIDAGANYGEMLLEPAVADCPRVLAFEPNPRVLPYLRKTMEGADNVEIHEAALSNYEGEGAFSVDSNWSGMSRLGHGANEIRVRITTVDQILGPTPTTNIGPLKLLMKLDVEGGELNVIRGARRSMRMAASFCCLVEVKFLALSDLMALASNFNLYGLNMQQFAVTRIESPTVFRNAASPFWQQDVLLTYKRN